MIISTGTTYRLEDLFTHRPDGEANPEAWQNKDKHLPLNFWIQGCAGRFDAKPKLIELLENRGLVYSLNEHNFFFKIGSGRLFLKYQFISGGRHVCDLEQD